MKQWFSRGIVLSVLVLSLSNCKKDYSNSNGYGGGAPNPPPSGPILTYPPVRRWASILPTVRDRLCICFLMKWTV